MKYQRKHKKFKQIKHKHNKLIFKIIYQKNQLKQIKVKRIMKNKKMENIQK